MFKNEEMEINLGPQHPSTHGVLRVKLRLDGETITHCRPMIGYLHRGVEKICENQTFFQGQVWTDRMDYCSAVANNLGWAEANEKLFGITVSNNCDARANADEQLRKQRYEDHLVVYGEIGHFQRDLLLTKYYERDVRKQLATCLIVDEVDSMWTSSMRNTL